MFAPPIAWADPDGPADGSPVSRSEDEGRWWGAVYSDTSLITQIDDGTGDLTTGEGLASSSCSAPGVVVTFLERLRPEDCDRVLEVGTGTGWTAGLSSWRVGEENVTSVEIDTGLSEQAAKNLAATGHAPRLIAGDGAAGFPERAPYDRVQAACAVAQIPYAWVEQTRPGGIIALPWSPGYGYGWLTRLHVMNDGTAVGRFPSRAGYMLMRSQRPVLGATNEFVHGEPEETVTRLDPRRLVVDSDAADLAIAAMVPGVQTRMYYGRQARPYRLRRPTARGTAPVGRGRGGVLAVDVVGASGPGPIRDDGRAGRATGLVGLPGPRRGAARTMSAHRPPRLGSGRSSRVRAMVQDTPSRTRSVSALFVGFEGLPPSRYRGAGGPRVDEATATA